MPSHKRASNVPEDELTEHTALTLRQVRNMWQFANLCQWIYIFGKAAKIDDALDIEEIEIECLKPHSTILADIALALLKLVSSHRGLTHDIFDAQARKQYLARFSGQNPFGTEDAPQHFTDFDTFTKIKVLQQLTQWVMVHPERLRDHMEEQKDMEQTTWRIEPYGWDSQDRTYYVLDDNRIYRLSQPPASPKHALGEMKSRDSGLRASKRRRVSQAATNNTNVKDASLSEIAIGSGPSANDELGGLAWECIAITLSEVQQFLGTMARTRDENEKTLKKQLEIHLLPILEKQEETRRRKQTQRERELLNQAKMANAKRSSRIANKMELQKLEEKAQSERHQIEQEAAARRQQEKRQQEIEREREFRFKSRARRLKEREARRLCHEEKVLQLSEEQRDHMSRSGRVSERRLQAEINKNRQALRDLEKQETSWVFDCSCGVHGQVDDGTHCVACERCNTWQHSRCLGISEAVAEQPDFQFICASCSHHEDERERPPPTPIKIKLHVTKTASDTKNSTGNYNSPGHESIYEALIPVNRSSNLLLPSPQSTLSPHANDGQQHGTDRPQNVQEPTKSHLSSELAPSSNGHDAGALSNDDPSLILAD